MLQVLADEGRRLQAGLEGLLGTAGERQRELSREVLSPTVKRHMGDAYTACAEERGPGSFARMKACMAGHVNQEKRVMFKDAGGECLG